MVKHARLKLGFRTPLLCAAGLALGACSQQGPGLLPGASQTPAAPAGASAPEFHEPLAALRASTLITMPVESHSGRVLGQIQDIVFNSNGRATNVIVAYGKGGINGKLVAIPWQTVVSDIHHGALVVHAARLAGAPSFELGSWPDIRDPSWSATADAYWTTPVDSTSRSRSTR